MYYILDCQDNVVGNHKGYKTFKGANYALKRYFEDKLWERYYAVCKTKHWGNIVYYSIRCDKVN